MQVINAKDVAGIVASVMHSYPNWYELGFPEMDRWHNIRFDDGTEVKSHIKQTFYNGLFWRIFNMYPNTRILPEHHIESVLNGESLDSKTHTVLCSRILKSVVQDNQLWDPEPKEALLKEIYQTISDAQLALSRLTTRNVSAVDYLDFLEIARHPKLEELKQEAYKDPRKIKATYDAAIELMQTDPKLWHNGLSKAVRCKMVRTNQVVQCVVFRGIPSEVDGAIYKRPIWSNYTFGNTKLYDFASDSRTAAKSHYYSDSSLKNAEYMSRKFRLFTNPVERIDWTDCGNDDFLPWVVKGAKYDSAGAQTYKGDLPNLIGKFYRTEEGGEVKYIEGNEKELIGKKIWIRSIINCKTPNPHMRCSSCIGMISQNISRFANIGHLGSITTSKDVSQNILSIKHVNTSATALKVLLGESERKFMHTGPEGTGFFINDKLMKSNPRLIISRKHVQGLTDIAIVDDIDSISLPRISDIPQVKVVIDSGNREVSAILKLTQKLRNPMLSRDFCSYAKEHSWDIDSSGNFVFDLSKWNPKEPLFIMPRMEESFSDLSDQVESLVRANQGRRRERHRTDAPARLVQELFDLVNSMLSVNILSMEIITYSLMVKSPTNSTLAGSSEEAVLGIGEAITQNRSLSSAMFYQGQTRTMTNPISFLKGSRPDSPMDVFFDPAAVVKEYNKRKYG